MVTINRTRKDTGYSCKNARVLLLTWLLPLIHSHRTCTVSVRCSQRPL